MSPSCHDEHGDEDDEKNPQLKETGPEKNFRANLNEVSLVR